MSQSNKLVVLGARGMLGHHTVKALELYAPNLKMIPQINERFINSVDITSYLSNLSPATVINCMGYFGKDPMLNLAVNACLPRAIADWCTEHGSLYIHISTNAVFAPQEDHCWGVDDKCAPETPYEVAKLFGEDPRAYVIRTSFIGSNPQGRGIYERLCSGQPFLDRKWNGVTVWVLAKRIVEIVMQHHGNPTGFIEHIHSPDSITFQYLAGLLGSSSTCKGYVKDGRLLGGGIKMPSIEEQLTDYRQISFL